MGDYTGKKYFTIHENDAGVEAYDDRYVEWLESQLASVKRILGTIDGINFLAAKRNTAFQMPGAYDGAMSEECKRLCREEYEIAGALLAELTNAQ